LFLCVMVKGLCKMIQLNPVASVGLVWQKQLQAACFLGYSNWCMLQGNLQQLIPEFKNIPIQPNATCSMQVAVWLYAGSCKLVLL
jgi:hypothetical protein